MRRMLICPGCDGADGFVQQEMTATCNKCRRNFDLFDLFLEVLTQKHDSDLWSYPFSILSEFKLAPIYEGIVPAEHFTYTALKYFEIDLKKEGIPENARILYVNISQEGDGTGPILMMAQVIGYELRSIANIPLTLRFVPILRNPATDPLSIDLTKTHRAHLYVRWCLVTGNEIISDHLVRCAEAYWKNDFTQVVYNGFAAFELQMNNTTQLYWSKVKSIDDANYERLFGRENINKKMTNLLSLVCKDLGVIISESLRQKFKVIEELRIQRNEVVHSGHLRPGTSPDKRRLFAGLCWALMFLRLISDKIDTRKQTDSGPA